MSHPNSSPTVASAGRAWSVTRTQFVALGSIALAVIGTFLPWVTAAGESASGIGLGGPGVTIIVCALISAALVVVGRRRVIAHVVSILAALIAAFIAVGNFSTAEESGFVDSGFASIEPGLHICVVGTVAWLALSLVLLVQRLVRRT